MAGSTIDHLVSLMVFLGAILLFISLFNQTLQTAILYQRHRNFATKCSDLLDNILLNPGYPLEWEGAQPIEWGKLNCTPTGFGLQDPEFTQYRLSPYSLMRLLSSTGTPVYYNATGLYYSNITMGDRGFLLVPYTLTLNYSTATKLLGINNTYGIQLSITPIISISIKESQISNTLTLKVSALGMGFPLSNAAVSYCFLRVNEQGGQSSPSYAISFNTAYTNDEGVAVLTFQNVSASTSYAFIVYAHISGLIGIGYYDRVFDKQYVIPFIDSFEEKRVLLAHSYDVHYFGPPVSAVFYNATFVLLTEDFTLREMPLGEGKVDKVVYGHGSEKTYKNITIPTYNPGILIISYQSNNGYGVVLMPWGISSMAFPVSFGEDPLGKEWVATDIRQALVNNIAYQAKLALWSLQGYQVIG
jgi:hypothetical protein